MREIIAVVLVAVVAVAGAAAFSAATVTAGDDRVAENETFDPATSPVTVENWNTTGAHLNDPANETVWNESGVRMAEGVDYTYNPGNGTLTVTDDGRLAGDSVGYITYHYQQTSSEQRGLAGLLAGHMELLGGALFVGIVLFLLAILKGAM